ncbi:MAG: glycosyltransferase family 2 protein [Candidatus Homeothermus sp.]|nr:glycosyltransferase family 2 protein [Candidatus Homeothermus sp.]
MVKLALVSPCYNEEEVLTNSAARLTLLFDRLIKTGKISPDSFVLFVNDGSKDHTWEIIKKLNQNDSRFHGIDLAHNSGHQTAIMAGMMTVRDDCDAVITIDADLQDDIDVIENMVDSYENGYDVVYGVKVSRDGDSRMKRLTAMAFYKLQRKMGVEAIYNHADFRLLSKRVLDELARFDERNLYLRGIIPLIGYPSTTVNDTISERQGGKSKYTFKKMFSLALDGITSFSVQPIYGILSVGVIFMIISVAIGIYVLYSIVTDSAVSGWSSLIISIWFVGGVILLSVGVVGLYIGKIFSEVKRRPRYSVKERV